MGMLYNYAKAGGGTLPAAAGEVRGADVSVPAAALKAGDGHEAAKLVCVYGRYPHCQLGACRYLCGLLYPEGKR